MFEEQISFLTSSGFRIVSLDEYREMLLKKEPIKKRVVLTFDDGTRDFFEYAAPIIEKNRVKSVVFVSSNPLQNLSLGANYLPDPENYMTPNMLIDLRKSGIEIGSHGKSHIKIGKCAPEIAKSEIEDSKKIIEDKIGEKINWFCYPYGSFDLEKAEMARAAGYSGACSVIRDNRNSAKYLFYLKRIMVMRTTSTRKFQYYFSELYHIIHSIKNKKRWLV